MSVNKKIGVQAYPNVQSPVKLNSKMLLDPKPAGEILFPSIVYFSPFKVADNRFPYPKDYDGYLTPGSINYPFMPGGELIGALSRLLGTSEILFAENVTLNKSAIDKTSPQIWTLFESALSETWGNPEGGIPALLAVSQGASATVNNGYQISRYTGGEPFIAEGISAGSEYSTSQELIAIPNFLKNVLKTKTTDLLASGKFSQNIVHIEDFSGYENISGDYFEPPEAPVFFYGETTKGYDSGYAYDTLEDTYEFEVTFTGQNGRGVVDKSLVVEIRSVEAFSNLFFLQPSGDNTYALEGAEKDNSFTWVQRQIPQSNYFSEKVQISGAKIKIKLSGLSVVSRVVYPDELGDGNFYQGHGSSIVTHMLSGINQIYMDRLYRVEAVIQGTVAVGWVWVNLTPVLFAARYLDGGFSENYRTYPSWFKFI